MRRTSAHARRNKVTLREPPYKGPKYSQDDELRARIAALEQQLGARDAAAAPAPAPGAAERFVSPPTSSVDPDDAEPDVMMSRRRRKKYVKKRRKESRRLRKTELHANALGGMVLEADRIVVPEYMVNAGYDVKFEADPTELDLKGILTPRAFFRAVSGLNQALSHARAKPVDFLLLGTCTVMPFGLIAWAVRHRKHRSKHKKILVDYLRGFNDAHAAAGVRMRWRRKPASELVIERFTPVAAAGAAVVAGEGTGGGAEAGAAAAVPAALQLAEQPPPERRDDDEQQQQQRQQQQQQQSQEQEQLRPGGRAVTAASPE